MGITFKAILHLLKCKIAKNVKFENVKNISIGKKVSIGECSVISGYKGGILTIENNVSICRYCKIATCGGELYIGENTQIGDLCTITAQGGVYIGKNVLMADKINIIANAHIYDNINVPIANQNEISKPIYIGDGSWIGINVSILGGVKIGKNCVIGANSVVTKDVADYSVVGGSPAKVLKYYSFEQKVWVKV